MEKVLQNKFGEKSPVQSLFKLIISLMQIMCHLKWLYKQPPIEESVLSGEISMLGGNLFLFVKN